MDSAEKDLRSYYLARNLHLTAELKQVYTQNAFTHPMLYSCLDPRAKAEALRVMLCLRRWLAPEAVEDAGKAHAVRTVTQRVLEYLSFPQFVSREVPASSLVLAAQEAAEMDKTRSLKVHATTEGTPLASPAITGVEAATAAAGTPTASPSRFSVPSPLQLDRRAASGTLAEEMTIERDGASAEGIAAAVATTTRGMRGDTASQSPKHAAAATHARVETALQPLFYVRPNSAQDPRQPHQLHRDSGHCIFVRMIHRSELNEETLNPFFGRYGQVGCELVRSVRVSETAFTPAASVPGTTGETAMPLLSAEAAVALALQAQCEAHELFMQDFIVSVDSRENALHAVERAYYKELIFIAPSNPGHNCLCVADLDRMLSECIPVYRVDPPALVKQPTRKRQHRRGEETDGNLKEKRKRRRRRSGSPLPSSSDSSSSSTSSTTTSSSEEDEEDNFVPDILVDGLPYWITEDQLKVLFQDYGTIEELRLAIDDLSGAFTGAVLVRMATVQAALQLSEAMHGSLYQGIELVSGVLDEKLDVVSLRDGNVVLQPLGETLPRSFNVTVNDRVWV